MRLLLSFERDLSSETEVWLTLPSKQQSEMLAVLARRLAKAAATHVTQDSTETREETAMTESSKVPSTHVRRCAFVCVRQSSTAQGDLNRESIERQYPLVERAIRLGSRPRADRQDLGNLARAWPRDPASLHDRRGSRRCRYRAGLGRLRARLKDGIGK
jgi:hypothetical protein